MMKRSLSQQLTIVLILFISLLLSNAEIAFHHHDHGYHAYDDCPICAAAHVFSSSTYSTDT